MAGTGDRVDERRFRRCRLSVPSGGLATPSCVQWSWTVVLAGIAHGKHAGQLLVPSIAASAAAAQRIASLTHRAQRVGA